jgi:hypothetical protein
LPSRCGTGADDDLDPRNPSFFEATRRVLIREVDRSLLLAGPSGPEPLDQDAGAVIVALGVVGPLQAELRRFGHDVYDPGGKAAGVVVCRSSLDPRAWRWLH